MKKILLLIVTIFSTFSVARAQDGEIKYPKNSLEIGKHAFGFVGDQILPMQVGYFPGFNDNNSFRWLNYEGVFIGYTRFLNKHWGVNISRESYAQNGYPSTYSPQQLTLKQGDVVYRSADFYQLNMVYRSHRALFGSFGVIAKAGAVCRLGSEGVHQYYVPACTGLSYVSSFGGNRYFSALGAQASLQLKRKIYRGFNISVEGSYQFFGLTDVRRNQYSFGMLLGYDF